MFSSPFTASLYTATVIFFMLVMISLGFSIADEHSQAFATGLVGLGAFFIGIMQWSSNQSKVKLDYYTKRYAVYAELKTAWLQAQKLQIKDSQSKPVKTNYDQISEQISESRLRSHEGIFLYDSHVHEQIENYYKELYKQLKLKNKYLLAPVGKDANEKKESDEQIEITRSAFKKTTIAITPYLDITHIK